MKEESQVAAQKQRFKLVTDKKFYKRVLSIMLPVALQQAINMGVNMLDTIMLGQFGEVQISSSSLANQYYNFFTIFCMGIIGGSSTGVPVRWRRYVRPSIWRCGWRLRWPPSLPF